MPLDASERKVVMDCIEFLQNVEDQVGEVRRRLRKLLENPIPPPEWAEANAMMVRAANDPGGEQKRRIC